MNTTKMTLALFFAIVAAAAVISLTYMGYSGWKRRQNAIYDQCYRQWDFNPQGKTIEQACGEAP